MDGQRNADVDVASDVNAYLGLKVVGQSIPPASQERVMTVTNNATTHLSVTVEVMDSSTADVQFLSTKQNGRSESQNDSTPCKVTFFLPAGDDQKVYMKASSTGTVDLSVTAQGDGLYISTERTVGVEDDGQDDY